MLNRWQGIGNLGRDPEARTTQSGLTVCSFSLAVNERQKKGEEWVDHTEWVNVVAMGKLAENVVKFCQKGKQVYVEGRLSTRKWQDKAGQDRWTTEVVASDVKFLGGAKREEPAPGRGSSRPQSVDGPADVPLDDEIPF